MPESHVTDDHGLSQLYRRAPVRTTFAAIAFISWFAFAAVSAIIGGDAIGTTPSQSGFVVTSHGNETSVSEGVWLFGLLYPAATLALSPIAVFLLLMTQRHHLKGWPRILVPFFIALWGAGWYFAIARDAGHSILDYLSLDAL